MRNLPVGKRILFIITCLTAINLFNCGDTPENKIDQKIVASAEQLTGLTFTKAERESMLVDLIESRESYESLRQVDINNSVPPAIIFNPLPLGFVPPSGKSSFILSAPGKVTLPANRADLAFYSLRDLGVLIRTKQISSLELTKFFLARLKKYDSQLHCVITLTEELALAEASKAR